MTEAPRGADDDLFGHLGAGSLRLSLDLLFSFLFYIYMFYYYYYTFLKIKLCLPDLNMLPQLHLFDCFCFAIYYYFFPQTQTLSSRLKYDASTYLIISVLLFWTHCPNY